MGVVSVAADATAGGVVRRLRAWEDGAAAPALVATGGPALLGFVSAVAAVRGFGDEGRGLMAQVQLVPVALGALATLGLPDAVVHRLATGHAGDLLRAGVRTVVGVGVAATLLGAVAVPLLLAAGGGGPGWLAAYALVTPGLAVAMLAAEAARGARRWWRWAGMRVALTAVWLVAVLVALAAGAGPGAALALHVAGVGALALWSVRWLFGAFPATGAPSGLRAALRFGLPVVVAGAPQIANQRVDQVVLTVVVPRSDLGAYVTAVGWSICCAVPVVALASVVHRAVAAAPPDRQWSVVRRQGRSAALVAAVSAVLGVVLSLTLFTVVFGQDVAVARPAAVLLCIGAACTGLAAVAAEAGKGLGLPGTVVRGEVASLAVTVALVPLAVPRWGITGAAAVALLAYATNAAVQAGRLVRAAAGRSGVAGAREAR